jgi:hypothetical protein
MYESGTVGDEQLTAALSAAFCELIGNNYQVYVCLGQKTLARYIGFEHSAVSQEKYQQAATAEGLVCELEDSKSFTLRRKGTAKVQVSGLDMREGLAVYGEPESLPATEQSKPKPAIARADIPENPAAIAVAARGLIENARQAGRAMSATEAVKSVMKSNCAKPFDPNDANSIALAARSIVEAAHRKGQHKSYADAVVELIGARKKLDPNSPAAIALRARELVATTRNSGKFISYASAVAQVMSDK